MTRQRNLETTHIEARVYREEIDALELALAQLESIEKGETQLGCAVCTDTDHTAENCWFFNPLLLAELGRHALGGEYWKCFHCSAVFLSGAEALQHFGATPDSPAACLRELAKLAEETS